MARTPEETSWARQLLVGVAALIAVSLVIGGVVSVVALGAVKVGGLGETRSRTSAEPSLAMPSADPTTSLDPAPGPTADESDASPTPSPSATRKPRPKPAIRLRATPNRVGAGEQVTLSGTDRRGGPATLQVQRFETGWVDFPVTVNVVGGRFSTYITTSQVGATRLRVFDKAAGKASNEVRVQIG